MKNEITILISSIALLLSIFNFIFSIIQRRKEAKLKKRNDLIESDNKLDKAYENLFGKKGFSITKDRQMLEGAISLIKIAKKFQPKYSKVYEYEGLYFYVQGNIFKAKECYLEALKYKPKRWQTFHNLGLISEGEEAEKYYKKAIEIDDEGSGWPLYKLAGIEYHKGNIENSRQLYLKSLEILPNNYSVFFDLAFIEIKNNNLDKARSFYEKTISCNPKHVDAMVNLAGLLIKINLWDQGISWIEHAKKTDPEDGYPYAMMAGIYADKNMPEKSLENYKKAIEIDPKYSYSDNAFNQLYGDINNKVKKIRKN